MRRAVSVSLTLAGAFAWAGCGASTPAAPGADATASTAPTGSPDSTSPSTGPPATPTAPSSSKVTTTSLTGTVSSSAVEGNCLVLADAGSTYLLVGAVTGLTPGREVTVTGHVDPARATTCQTGTPFVVETVEPAGPDTG